ncbi:ribosome biogenesis GTP-binding protein YihA/YsxC [Paenibacillus sp. ACRRX]|uniref:ribosome biogenesis GTP-binding protein YihA/YsxC n=1 Tax=unclassified Paenibacillus TaxID=185978 RepID=UPI001EF4B390|nr:MULTISPECIES: ribosome biogenesis GTP-binding protein YihA/YsxC [unclassified Paenibacillus]MCG7410182.1 ribosome biogenesis GTP-binding protein YihA/YsxC [Paenibacillus sp. ACRRX]MDK8183765.1 ribosome biogenesis GTP-binding protein YihA/YsxC [Paenibacillus sp. UMB4589-SE434]
MKITSAEFIISAVGPAQYPEDGLPEVALAGRSNVGKSSLINKLIQRRNLARTSSQPGKTQQLNYYRINENVYFVDVPGYGFAKVSKTQREAWGKMIEAYIQEREPLKLVMQVIDLRHPPTKDDVLMYNWLTHYNIPLCIVATKADKLPKSQWQKHLKQVRVTLGMRPDAPLIMFSAETGAGREELWEIINKYAVQSPSEIDEAKTVNAGLSQESSADELV